ncbi:MAG TPA: GDP-mannose 4,6-dehydratase [Candidatus Saccharimonadales bacterium]|jgi:GDP-4-dehydro-6-deoxy-D-mannose reductase|nr:GDP-mannose 4,6-dehydratase [Candidatus Saccharimonadales bacterium]
MRILITGVTGLIGSQMARYAIAKGHGVWGLRRFRSDNKNILDIPKLKIINGEITDPTSVDRAVGISKPDIIFHFAGQSYPSESWDAPEYTIDVNLTGTLRVLESVRKMKKPAKVFIACSSAEYGFTKKFPTTEDTLLKPVSPYGVSKLAAEALGYQYFVNYKIPVYLGRYFIQVGPGQDERTSIQTFCKQMSLIEKRKSNPVIFTGDLSTKRDFLDARDGVAATWAVVTKGKPGKPYNICSGKAYKMKDVLKRIISKSKVSVQIKTDPKRLRPTDEPVIWGSNTNIFKDTGWKPKISIEDTVSWVLDYWKQRV